MAKWTLGQAGKTKPIQTQSKPILRAYYKQMTNKSLTKLLSIQLLFLLPPGKSHNISLRSNCSVTKNAKTNPIRNISYELIQAKSISRPTKAIDKGNEIPYYETLNVQERHLL
jgi:hypothetical protein